MGDLSMIVSCEKCGMIVSAFSSLRSVFDHRQEIDDMVDEGLKVDFVPADIVRNSDNWCKCDDDTMTAEEILEREG